MYTNVNKSHNLVKAVILSNNAMKFIYDTGKEVTVTSLIWSTTKNDDSHDEPTSGMVNFFQGGGVSGLGVFGQFVSTDNPITFELASVPTVFTDIPTLADYLIANFNA